MPREFHPQTNKQKPKHCNVKYTLNNFDCYSPDKEDRKEILINPNSLAVAKINHQTEQNIFHIEHNS